MEESAKNKPTPDFLQWHKTVEREPFFSTNASGTNERSYENEDELCPLTNVKPKTLNH
jgi:hypothetical protein